MARTLYLDAQWDIALDVTQKGRVASSPAWSSTSDYVAGDKVTASNGYEYEARASSGPSQDNRFPPTDPVREDYRVWSVLGGAGIAVVDGPYAIAQDVANAVRLFTDDAYFDADKGIPHFDIELGHKPPIAVLRSRIAKAARAVEGVASAEVILDEPKGRVLGGEILLTTTAGQTISVAI